MIEKTIQHICHAAANVSPFTSDDVMFTYRRMIDPRTPTAYGEDFRQVKKFEVLDPLTVRVTYGEPFAPALISWGFSVMPKHLLEGKDITASPLARALIGKVEGDVASFVVPGGEKNMEMMPSAMPM